MNRAERRRLERERGKRKEDKTYTLTQSQLDEIKRDEFNKAIDTAFTLMLGIPLEVLKEDGYWKKTAKRRLPPFIDDCLGLYESYLQGVLTLEELRDDLWKWGKVKVNVKREKKLY